jgi:predicted N-acyltransferase
MNIRRSSRLSAEAKAQWIAWLPDNSAATAAIDLCDALQDSSKSVSVLYLEVFSSDQQPLGLAVTHTIHRLDLAPFVGGITEKIFAAVGKLGMHPLAMDVAFLEIPYCNLPGVFLTSEGERVESDVVRELIRFARAELRCDIFCVKTDDHRPSEKALVSLGMLHTSFLENTRLKLPFSTFEEYLRSLPLQWRTNIRTKRNRFADVNGRVIWVTDIESAAQTAADLFHSTTDFHRSKGDMGRPLDMDANFLRCLAKVSHPDNRFLLLCEANGQIVVAGLVLRSGKLLFTVKAGLNYDAAKPTKAYFNFYYSAIEFAIQNRLECIEFAAEAYDVKRRMGGTTSPVSYYMDINNKWIAPIVKLLMKHFSEVSA